MSQRPGLSLFLALSLAVSLSLAAPAGAEEGDISELACEFRAGTSSIYNGGTFEQKPPAPLAFGISGIDLGAQLARLKSEAGGEGASLRVVRALNANHFLEVVTEGFLNLTTVYDKDPATGRYPAVHSRHFGLLGQAVVAQYTGSCTSK